MVSRTSCFEFSRARSETFGAAMRATQVQLPPHVTIRTMRAYIGWCRKYIRVPDSLIPVPELFRTMKMIITQLINVNKVLNLEYAQCRQDVVTDSVVIFPRPAPTGFPKDGLWFTFMGEKNGVEHVSNFQFYLFIRGTSLQFIATRDVMSSKRRHDTSINVQDAMILLHFAAQR